MYRRKICEMSVIGEDRRFFFVEIQAMKPGICRNGWDIKDEAIERGGKTFVEQPILTAYVNGRIGDKHNHRNVYDPEEGCVVPDFTSPDSERIVGEITETRMELENGTKWLYFTGRIWKHYARKLVNELKANKNKSVSVEVDVTDVDETDDTETWNDFIGLGVTILGDNISPAIEGTHIKALVKDENFKREFSRMRAAVYEEDERESKGTENDEKGIERDDAKKERGERKRMSSKVQTMSKLCKIFPDFKVLNYTERDGNVETVLLLKEGVLHTYAFKAEDNWSVNPGRLMDTGFHLSITDAEGRVAEFDGEELISQMTSDKESSLNELRKKCLDLEAENKRLQEEKDAAEKKCDKLEEEEQSRRCAAVTQVIKTLHRECREATPGVSVSDDKYNDLIKEAASGSFNRMLNENGDWVGEELAKEKYLALYGAVQKEKASTKKPSYQWFEQGITAMSNNDKNPDFYDILDRLDA